MHNIENTHKLYYIYAMTNSVNAIYSSALKWHM